MDTSATQDKLTPGERVMQRGQAEPPPPTGETIRITVEAEGQSEPLTITLRAPTGQVAVAAPSSEVLNISHSHVAGVSVKAPQESLVPSTTLVLNHLFQTRSEQMDLAEKRFTIHEGIDQAMKDAFAPMMQTIDPQIFTAVTRIVHQMMAELLSGNLALAIPADEVMRVRDAMVDQAVLHVKNHQGKGAFNPQALRQTLETHPAVMEFRQMHHPSHSHALNMRYHPRTGVDSRTVIAANVSHHGMVCETKRGQMAEAGADY